MQLGSVYMRMPFLCVVTGGLLCTPAMAEIILDQARIDRGELVVRGRLTVPGPKMITLDGSFRTDVDQEGAFVFRLAYHPPDCIVTLATDQDEREAVVG